MLVFLFIFTLLIVLMIGVHHHLRCLRRQMIFRLLERCILNKLSLQNWYSSAFSLKLAEKLNKKTKKELVFIFAEIKKGNFSSLTKIYSANELKLICGKKTKSLHPLINAELALLDFDFKKASKLIENLKAINNDEKARLLLAEAKIAMNEGDMETASHKTALAIKLFQKLGFVFEEACAYLLYGTIYRASGIPDTAQIMLKTSADLFKNINAKAAEAEVYGNIGMLLVMDKRFDEAIDYFEKAINLFAEMNNADSLVNIYNQKALTMLISNNLPQATAWIKKALTYCSQKNLRGLSLNYDISAQTAFAKQQYAKAVSLAKHAVELYMATNNLSAKLEMMYLIAQAQLKQKHFSASEKTLRNIIDEATGKQTCFHIANAYSLLGILFMQKKDFSRAKGLFNQSLCSELNNERWCGVAIDYANIALTEYRKGRKEEGYKNKVAALKYAEESGDKELISYLKSTLNAFDAE